MNRPKLCGNCAFQQNFYTSKLGETTVSYAVKVTESQDLSEKICFQEIKFFPEKLSQFFLSQFSIDVFLSTFLPFDVLEKMTKRALCPKNIYLFNGYYKITWERCEICLKLTIKTPEPLHAAR